MTNAIVLLPLDKRWVDRREVFVPPTSRINPAEFGVEIVKESDARRMVIEHHYSGSFPAARLSVGLFRKTGVERARLVGAAVFSVPIQQRSIPRYTGLPPAAGVELGRFVCAPEVAFNGETWFLRRAFQALRAEKHEVRAVLSYADPLERTTAEGWLTKPSHYGQIYQAHNASFLGRSGTDTILIALDGSIVSRRAISKVRNHESGHAYAERRLLNLGADHRQPNESPSAWLDRVLRPPLFRRVRHPGNFVYVFGLDDTVATQARGNSLPYPKRRTA